MKNTFQNDTGAMLLVLSAIMCVLLIALTISNFINIKKVNEYIKFEYISLENNNERLDLLRQLKEVQPELEYTYSVLKKQIPSGPEDYKIIEQIEEYSSRSSADFIRIEFGDYTVESDINAIPYSLTLKGKYPDLINLLNEIKTGERLFRLDSFKIVKTEDSKIRADIEGFAFYN